MSDKSRRVIGSVIGLLMGLAYGLVNLWINPLFLPGIPLYNPPPGAFGDLVIACLGGGLMGLLAAWPEEATPGVLLSSLVGAVGTTLMTLLGDDVYLELVAGTLVLLLVTFLPRAILFIPIGMLVRWGLRVWSVEFQSVAFSIRRLALTTAIILLLAGAAGALSLYSRQGRQALTFTNELVKAGSQAASREDLPEPLRTVDGYIQGARGAYSLQLSDNPDIIPVQRPIAGFGVREYAVLVRFENGYHFGCAFTPPHTDPACQTY
jgi:hypothetical protein